MSRKWQSLGQRYGLQVGALDSFLRTQGLFTVSFTDPISYKVALQASRNLYQYFSADNEIVHKDLLKYSSTGNTVSVCWGFEATSCGCIKSTHPIQMVGTEILLFDASAKKRVFTRQEGLGAIYLAPAPEERLELVVWGADEEGLRQAARLIPTMSGVGQPDFVIVRRRCAAEGAAGVLAMGFFDHSWKISEGSYFA